MYRVKLTQADCYLASEVGIRRRISSQYRGSRNRAGSEETDTVAKQWFNHIIGAQGELAFCRCFGIDWPALVDRPDEPDAYPDWEVRTSQVANVSLLCYPDDHKERRYVLVTADCRGFVPVFTIHGWQWGYEILSRPAEAWNDRRPDKVHRIPTAELFTEFNVAAPFAGYIL